MSRLCSHLWYLWSTCKYGSESKRQLSHSFEQCSCFHGALWHGISCVGAMTFPHFWQRSRGPTKATICSLRNCNEKKKNTQTQEVSPVTHSEALSWDESCGCVFSLDIPAAGLVLTVSRQLVDRNFRPFILGVQGSLLFQEDILEECGITSLHVLWLIKEHLFIQRTMWQESEN